MNIEYRTVTDDDFEFFWQLNRSCYQDVVIRQFGKWDDADQFKNYKIKWLDQKFKLIVVDDEPVGGYWVDEHEEFHLLREVQIHPDFQGKGLGGTVVGKAIQGARSAGKPLRLRVLFQNEAIRLYERLGFEHIGKNEHQYIMEKPL